MKGVYVLEELNMTVFFCIMVDSSWISFSTSFDSFFQLVFFFCQLLPSAQFLKKLQNCNVTNFCIVNNLFQHKYNDKNFSKGNKKQVSLRNQLPFETSFPAKPASPRNQLPCETSFSAKTASLRNQVLCKSSFLAKPVLDAEVV